MRKIVKKIDDLTQCIGQILVYAFTIKYEFTSALIGQMIWPFFLFLGVLIFNSEIKDLLTNITEKIPYVETLVITADGIQISVSEDIKSNVIDPKEHSEEFEIISQLTGEEIIFLVDNSEPTDSFQDSPGFKKNYKNMIKSLEEAGLYDVDYQCDKNPKTKVHNAPGTEWHNKKYDVCYQPSEQGNAVIEVINDITAECFINGCVFNKE